MKQYTFTHDFLQVSTDYLFLWELIQSGKRVPAWLIYDEKPIWDLVEVKNTFGEPNNYSIGTRGIGYEGYYTYESFEMVCKKYSLHFVCPQITPKPDIVQELANLQPSVQYNGIDFQLIILMNRPTDMRICYAGGDDLIWKEWVNPFTESMTDHLYIYENIATEDDLREAIADCREFLISNDIWKP